MTSLSASAPIVHAGTADAWPAWTDEDRWEADDDGGPADDYQSPPSAEDAEWAAENLNDDPEPDWDAMAEESAAMDRLERGLCG